MVCYAAINEDMKMPRTRIVETPYVQLIYEDG